MKYITILDFEKGEIHSFPYFDYLGESFEEISEVILDTYEIEFKEENCQWIIQDFLDFQIHGLIK